MKCFNSYLFILSLILILSQGCHQSKENLIPGSTTTEPEELLTLADVPKPVVQNEYLVFESWEDVYTFMSASRRADGSLRKQYEESIGFASMQRVYDEFEEYSLSSVQNGYDRPIDEIRQEYLGTLIFDDEFDYEMDLFPVSLSEAVNRHSWIQVGDTLYGFKMDRFIRIAEPSPEKIAYAHRLPEDNPSSGILIQTHEIETNGSARTFCSTVATIPGTFKQMLSNGWGYQDNNSPGGAKEWKQEILWESHHSASGYHTFIQMKYRKRGAFGLWYAYKPLYYYVVGSSDITSNTGLFSSLESYYVNISYIGSGSNSQSTWKEYIFSDQTNLSPAFVIPVLGENLDAYHWWVTGCLDVDLSVTFETGDYHIELI